LGTATMSAAVNPAMTSSDLAKIRMAIPSQSNRPSSEDNE
jgi:hypothetical protein